MQNNLCLISWLIHYMMIVLVSLTLCMGLVSGDIISGLKKDANMMITRSCIEKERQTLLVFKANLVDVYDNLYDWGSKEEVKKDCCQWVGVRCNNHTGHVIELDLSTSSNGLSGKISPSLPLLHQLQYLNLNGIDFQSTPIPNFLGSLTNLQRLEISNANLSGPISHQLGNLSNLLHLDLSRNFLSGYIPLSFGDLTSLTHLDLSGNQLQGVIPKSFGNISSLVQLNLSKNLLNGSVPNFVGCSSKELIIDHNNVYNRIPNFTGCSSLSNLSHGHYSLNGSCTGCPSLQKLDLSSNRLSGNLPRSVGQLPNLEYLDVSSNSLNGVISNIHFVNLTQLTYLDLSFNSFEVDLSSHGTIPFQLKTIKMQSCKLGPIFPAWIQTQRDFAHLDISYAGISDGIPTWFWDLPPGLKFLNMSSNEIKGMLPDMTSDFERYPGMDLSNNQLEGRIPLLPSKLAALNLSGNRFSGTLSFLCKIDVGLTFLDLSDNFLSGDLPERYPGMDLSNNQLEGRIPLLPSKLAALNLSGNRFSGTLSFLCKIDVGLTFLDLSDNFLSGDLPDCWLKFHEKLVVLNLSNNNLSGEIPSSLGFLSQLEALYLRKNVFVGELPMSLSNCTKLRFVDLGENELSGNVPAWIGERLSELYVLVLRSNRFFGSLPSQLCWLNNLQFLDLSKNRLLGSIPHCFGNFTAMARRGFRDDINDHSYSSYIGTIPKTSDHITYAALNRNNVVLCSGRGARYFSCGSNEEAIFIDNALVAWKGTDREFERGLHLLKSIDLSSNKLSGKLPYEITSLGELVVLKLSVNKLHGEVPKNMGRLKSLESLDLSGNEFSGNIPSSLSDLTFLSYLNLSNNDFSGSIPSGPQLQLFDASFYSGNPRLCGPPLAQRCGPPPPSVAGKEDDGEGEDDLWKSYYIGMGIGFAVGFWGICGALFLNRRCRYFFFASLSYLKDWIYVTVAVHFQKLQRRFTR